MTAPWTRLTPAILQSRFSKSEMESIRRAAGAFDDAAAQQVLDQTASMARGYIATNPHARLSVTPYSVPPALVSTCLDIALVDYSQSIAGVLLDPKSLRQDAAKRAYARLESVRKNEFTVETPDAAEDAGTSSAASPNAPTTYVKTLLADRASQRGLL